MLNISKKNDLIQICIIIGFLIGFLILYFSFIYIFYNFKEMSIFLIIGFSIIIIVMFYFFMNLNKNGENNILFTIKFLSEDWIKIILMAFMCVAIFIPPVSISRFIIEWNGIGYLNYFRAIIFIIGGVFVPGACIFNIIFPKSSLHERLKIEPFLLKLAIYPLISLTFLGTATLIIDVMLVKKGGFSIILFFIILLLVISDIIIQKFRNKSNFKSISAEIKISKYTFLILLLALAIILIAFGNHLKTRYSIFIDHYEAVGYVIFIGDSKRPDISEFYDYNIFWSFISFGLSSLCGIPPINTDALLFPFLYLFVISSYLFIKAILIDLKEKYAVLSTLFVITFSGSFNFVIGTSWLIFSGILFFTYKSFAIFLFLISATLLVIILKPSKDLMRKSTFRAEITIIIILSAFLLFNSYMLYILPVLPAVILFLLFFLFSNRKKQSYFNLLIYFSCFVIFFIIYDILLGFFFSFTNTSLFYGFLDLPQIVKYKDILFLNAVKFYIILIAICISGFFIYILIYLIFHGKKKEKKANNIYIRIKKNHKIKPKTIFGLTLIVFSILLISCIINWFIFKVNNFFFYYFTYLFACIGFIGILGLYLSYFCYKENRCIFFILFFWILLIILIASLLIFRAWYFYSNKQPNTIPPNIYLHMEISFSRIWFYSIIPLSIFAAIGLIKLRGYIKSRNFRKITNRNVKNVLNLTLISVLIVFTLSNTMFTGFSLNEREWYVDDDTANVLGWISEKLSPEEKILTDYYNLHNLLQNFPYYYTFYLPSEAKYFLEDINSPNISYSYDYNCFLNYIEYLDGYYNVLGFRDNNNNGFVSLKNNFEISKNHGKIEFMIRTTDKSKNFTIDLDHRELQLPAIRVMIRSNGFYGYNNDTLEKIIDMLDDVWYKIIIYFESTDDNYESLNKYYWKISINDIEYGDFMFMNNISTIRNFYAFSDIFDSNYEIFINELKYSFQPFIGVDIIYYAHNVLINGFKSEKIKFFVKYQFKDYYDRFSEDINSDFNYFFLGIDEYLLANLFKEEVYEYKFVTIYES